MNSEDSHALEPADETSAPLQDYIVPQEVLERIPEEEREEFSRKLLGLGIRISREERYAGPLQPALEAARWNELVTGSAERSFRLYEENERRRMDANDRFLAITEDTARYEMEIGRQQHSDFVLLTSSELKNSADEIKRGQTFAFVTVIGIIIGGFTMIHLGHDGGGIASLLVAAASVAGIFVSQFTKGRGTPSRSESVQPDIRSDSQS